MGKRAKTNYLFFASESHAIIDWVERSSHDLAVAANRLRALTDERAIAATMARYGHAIDLGHDDDWVACFVDDGEYDILYGRFEPRRLALGRRHTGGVLHKGRRQLAAFVAGQSRPSAGIHKHLLFSPLSAVEGDRATASSCFIRADMTSEGPEVQSFGTYRDRWRREAGSRWLIERREVAIDGMRS